MHRRNLILNSHFLLFATRTKRNHQKAPTTNHHHSSVQSPPVLLFKRSLCLLFMVPSSFLHKKLISSHFSSLPTCRSLTVWLLLETSPRFPIRGSNESIEIVCSPQNVDNGREDFGAHNPPYADEIERPGEEKKLKEGRNNSADSLIWHNSSTPRRIRRSLY